MHLFIAEIYVFSLDEVDWKTNAYNVFLVIFFYIPVFNKTSNSFLITRTEMLISHFI